MGFLSDSRIKKIHFGILFIFKTFADFLLHVAVITG